MILAADPIEDLVGRHLPLVRSLARRYLACGEPFDDLVQVGAVGLVAAARRFDAARGVPFAAYAAPTIDGELRRHLRDRASTIRVPRREQERAATLRRAARVVEQELGHEASLADTAREAGLPLEDARRAIGGSEATVLLSVLDDRGEPPRRGRVRGVRGQGVHPRAMPRARTERASARRPALRRRPLPGGDRSAARHLAEPGVAAARGRAPEASALGRGERRRGALICRTRHTRLDLK